MNLGSGNVPLKAPGDFAGPRGATVNVYIVDQPDVVKAGKSTAPALKLPRLPKHDKPVAMKADATDPVTMQKLSPTGKFRETRAVNPYNFNPHDTMSLLSNTGKLHITGKDANP
ncbi:MAG: hypothetical protein ACFHVJ_10785 [Aestuariibacter sp.]